MTLEYRTRSVHARPGMPPGDIPTIHLVMEAVAPFLVMASLPHGALQVANKCIPEATGLDIAQTTASESGT